MRMTMNIKTLMEKKLSDQKVRPEDIDSVVEPVEEFYGVNKDKAAQKLSDMTIDDNLDLIDSVRRGDKSDVVDILDEKHSIGDEVKIGDEDGVVKIPNGPGNTTGVLKDGELTMVKNSDLDNEPINEAILGMSRLPGLNRMMELAGIRAEEKKNPEEQGAEAKDKSSDPAQPAQSSQPAASAPAPAPEVAKVEISTPAPVPQTGEYQPIEMPNSCAAVQQEESPPALETVRCALDQIEAVISNLTVAEYREVRDRFTKLQNAIFESVSGRRRKPV